MPRMRAQHEALHPDPGYPQFGRDELDHAHAIYSVARSLSQLGLNEWLPRMMHWLGHCDGLETMLEDRYDPAICVRQVLLRHVVQQAVVAAQQPSARSEAQRQALKQAIVADLVQLDFVSYRAYWGQPRHPRAVWMPMEQSWLSFREGRQGDEQLCGWYSENAQEHVDALSAFLLADGIAADPDEREAAPS